MKISETDIGRTVADWLEAQGYEVYHEVRVELYGRRADLVAVTTIIGARCPPVGAL